MKKILLIVFSIFYSVAVFAQYTAIEVRLLTEGIGESAFIGGLPTNQSNDAGLSAILLQHNVTSYHHKYNHPYEPYANRMMEAVCEESEAGALVAALQAYSTVVETAQLSVHGLFNDALTLQINTTGIGVPLAEEGNPVVTNDDGLSEIFATFNVFYYAQVLPVSTNESILRYYNVVCDCNNVALKAALDNYTNVVGSVEIAIAGYPLLGNKDHQSTKMLIYPNPFADALNIETEREIIQYSIYDISGKLLTETPNKTVLQNNITLFSAGTYLLKLQFDGGESGNFKLIKK